MPQQQPPHQSPRAYRLWPPQAALCIKLGFHLFQFFPCQTFPLLALPQLGTHLSGLSSIPRTESWLAPLVAQPMINLARGSMQQLQRPMPAVDTTLHRAMENHLKQHWRHPTMAWVPQEVLECMTVRTTLTTVVMSLTKMSKGRMQPILIWNQPLGIVSLVQTLRRCH